MKRLLKKITIIVAAFSLFTPFLNSLFLPQVKAAEENAPIVIDGEGEDWLHITPIYDGGGVINKVSAFVTEDKLYGKMQLSSSGNFDTWHIYFETDGDTTNHLYKAGADYLLETDILYEYQGDSGEWDGLVGTAVAVEDKLSKDRKMLEFAIPLEAFGNPEKIGIHCATVANWADVANNPEAQDEYLDVPAFEKVYNEEEMVGLTEDEQLAYLASKQFAGTRSQWDSILYDAVYKNSNLKNLKAVTDGDNLYISVEAKALSNNFTIFVNTDKATYEVKPNGCVYHTVNGKKMDMGTQTEGSFKSDNGFEIAIPVEIFEGNTDKFEIYIDEEGERLPDEEGEKLTVTAPIREEAPVITTDGDPSDWAGIKPIGKGEGSLGDLYAFRDNDALHVMTYIKDVEDPESSAAYTTSLFISVDNDDKTGFQHSGYATHNSGDVLVQDWHSYGPDRNLEIFYASEPVILEWNMKNFSNSVEGYEKAIAATNTPGVYCAEYLVPIETLRGITPGIGDQLYICIDRNDVQTDEETYERLTPEGFTPARDPKNGSFAKVPKYNTTFDITMGDSDISDWESVPVSLKHVNTTNLVAVKSDEKLYTMVTAPGDLSTVNKFYIGTDKDGYTVDGRENVSYVVDKGVLYEVTGDDTVADEGVNVFTYYETDAVLMQVYMEKIGNPSKVSVAVDSNDGEYVLPESGMLTLTKSIEESRDEGFFYPVESFDFYNNPFKGWVGWADTLEGDVDTVASEHNLVYVDYKWSELEPEKGTYAFDAIEKQYQFEKWQKQGYRMVIRFVMDNPNILDGDPDKERMDIPQWLFDELKEENAEGEGPGTFYLGQSIKDLLGGCGFSPNYKSPKLLEYHRNVIKALAERYDDPSICAYVEVGSLGHWAEFHTWPTGTGYFPEPKLAQEYMQPYVDYFHNVKVGIRKPYAVAAENNWGLYNDIFGVTSDGGTPTFLQWAATGNTDMPESTEEDIAASAMPEWWKLNYSGGEFANGDFRTNALDENICAVLGQIRDSHTTWLGPCSACDFKIGDPDYDYYKYNIETMVKTMGYRYNLFSISEGDLNQGKNTIEMTWNNSGVAPIYYNCPVSLILKDASGNAVYEQVIDTDTTKWLPGRTNVKAEFNIPADVALGEYTLAVKMVTPDALAQTINLAMENGNKDGSYDLYKLTVNEGTVEETVESTEETTEEPTPAETASVDTTKTNATGYVIGGGVVAACIAAVAVLRSKKRGKK
ncbi:MAG: DUF4832 domain-containing protein [Lachnospiraceae bacterium]|jgi:hypothetical protein|nr:DUF4832 domain-containing protein [Lachnospiraceae bacterium]